MDPELSLRPKIDIDQLELFNVSNDGRVKIKEELSVYESSVREKDTPEERTAELRGGRYDIPSKESAEKLREILGPTAKQLGGVALTWQQKRLRAREISKRTGRRVAPENIGLTAEERRNLR